MRWAAPPGAAFSFGSTKGAPPRSGRPTTAALVSTRIRWIVVPPFSPAAGSLPRKRTPSAVLSRREPLPTICPIPRIPSIALLVGAMAALAAACANPSHPSTQEPAASQPPDASAGPSTACEGFTCQPDESCFLLAADCTSPACEVPRPTCLPLQCDEAECGQQPPSLPCDDGSSGDVCVRDEEGRCGWIRRCDADCPVEACGDPPPSLPCPDGGPGDFCRQDDAGQCGWVHECAPLPACVETECGPQPPSLPCEHGGRGDVCMRNELDECAWTRLCDEPSP